ncbi:MAG: hypothetical protein ACQESU_08725, partial [Halobacteriota archaeon]
MLGIPSLLRLFIISGVISWAGDRLGISIRNLIMIVYKLRKSLKKSGISHKGYYFDLNNQAQDLISGRMPWRYLFVPRP